MKSSHIWARGLQEKIKHSCQQPTPFNSIIWACKLYVEPALFTAVAFWSLEAVTAKDATMKPNQGLKFLKFKNKIVT